MGTLTPKHVHLLAVVFFQFHLEESVCTYKLDKALNANNEK